ncbi:MAG: DUF4493 domain-containing protein, partial [Alistipes sp.]|nr:DUF4493 domain-containing protein [Alistipes sp.]
MMKRLFNIGLWACLLALVSCINDPKVKEQDNTPSGEKGVVLLNVATRTVDGTTFDYILSIFKNEAGKSMLVRKYDSSKSDMQKPKYIWLLEGNYTAVVESGVKVSATFNASEQLFRGEEPFVIKGGETTSVDIVAAVQNIPVEVIFDQTITEGFHEGYSVEVKADDNVKLSYTENKTGYFVMPEGVNTLNWHFVGTFEYEDGEQVAVDKSGVIENVEARKSYKLSFKFSKDASGMFGGLTATLDESIEERDDHLSFSPDPELKGVGFDINAHCNYAGGERKYLATAAAEFVGVAITVGDTTFDPVSAPVAGIVLTGLNTPQLYITLSEDFFYSLNGGAQMIEMTVTDSGGSEARKELSYSLPGVNGYDKSKEVLAWAGCSSTLSATVYGAPSKVEILLREGEEEWKRSTASMGEENIYSVTIDGLEPSHSYEYALSVNDKMVGSPRRFTLAGGNQIPNSGLEDWCTNGDGVAIPYHTANNAYWCTGNYGTAILSKNITNSSSDVRPGSKGKKSMYMDSEYIVVKFAAGNAYIGSWGGMDGTNAKVYFGQPFEYNAKPKAIRFWAKWNCGTIDKVSSNVGKKGNPDLCKMFCALTTDSHLVDSSKGKDTTFSPSDADIKSGDPRYDKVLYSAYMDTTESNPEWKQIEIPFTFYGDDPNQVPTHIMLTFTCSGYGDFFDGSTDSWLYIDDI